MEEKKTVQCIELDKEYGNEEVTLMTDSVRYYIEDNIVFLNLFDVAAGLGFISYGTINMDKINSLLREFDLSPEVGSDGFIPENIFYLFCSRTDKKYAKEFQMKIANDVLPMIRKNGNDNDMEESKMDKKMMEAVDGMTEMMNNAKKVAVDNSIQIFENPKFGNLRTTEVDGKTWFIAKDVASALGYSNTRKAIADHVDDEDKNTVTIRDGIKGNPNMTAINESGIYALIFGSKLPLAKEYKHWVTSEVLPSIHNHGGYAVKGREMEFALTTNFMTNVMSQMTAIMEQQKLMINTISMLQQEVLSYRNVLASKPNVTKEQKVSATDGQFNEVAKELPKVTVNDSVDGIFETLSEVLHKENNIRFRANIYDRVTTKRGWKSSMTRFACHTKKALVEKNMNYKKKFVKIANTLIGSEEA